MSKYSYSDYLTHMEQAQAVYGSDHYKDGEEIETSRIAKLGELLSVGKYMEKNRDEGVVAQFGHYILIANCYDHGTAIHD